MGYRRVRRGVYGLGACVVGAIDPASGDTIASCPPTDPMAALTALGDQLAYLGTQIGVPAPTATTTFLGLSTTTWILIGGGVAFLAIMGGGRR
jgi:hypothetical protein